MSKSCRRRRGIKAYLLLITLIAFLLFWSQTAWVQDQEGIKPEKGYIVGSADEYEENEKDGLIIFKGNVKMIRENGYLYADKVTVYRDLETGDVLKTIAEGHVDMKDGDLKAKCEKAVLDEVNDIIELTGSVVVTRGSDRVEAPYVKYDRKTGRRIGRGGVKFKVQLKEKKKEKQ